MAAIRRLSADSFYRRFSAQVPERSTLVAPLLDRIDHVDHEMFLAWIGTRVVGIGQWDRPTTNPRSLEVALVVADAWQRRGIGRRLLGAIACDARRRGTTELHAHVMTTNERALNLARSMGPTDREVDGPDALVTFHLSPEDRLR
ncbi:MAG: N-acetyltransferase family protein [Acidimicrobiales bacterium]